MRCNGGRAETMVCTKNKQGSQLICSLKSRSDPRIEHGYQSPAPMTVGYISTRKLGTVTEEGEG